jgi:hypothetical protein
MLDAARRSRILLCPVIGAAALAVLAPGATPPASAQVAGPNVNMVSGTQWPGGDPFLQRQNEPSVAVSTRNPAHLLAGANDYRTVDLPGLPAGETADAWLGVFKSFDGGQTWQSTLVPGYPQDHSAEGLASPLKGFGAAADPVVRAGTDGLFYYSGITFNRDSNVGQVFVSRFIDLTHPENGDATQSKDPIRYLNTVVVDNGTPGQFLDKPWLAVDVPRAGARSCAIPVTPTQTVQAGAVYVAYARFLGSKQGHSQILFARSLDCGATWSHPIKIGAENHLNQGAAIAVDPVTGAVYVAWRQFANKGENDAIVITRSVDLGQSFCNPVEAAALTPFDQAVTPTQFRTNALPTLAVSVDGAGVSRVHLAWTQRSAPLADARIVLKTSADGVHWTTPPVYVDSTPLTDDFGATFGPGHQFMPSLTFSGGKLVVLYYDQRLDHTLGYFTPNTSNPSFPEFGPDPVTGSFYKERRGALGELQLDPSLVFTANIDEAGLTQVRHLIDLRVAQADPAAAPLFTSTRVSRYKFGADSAASSGYEELDQLEVNPPNLPMFKQGTLPFLGDYIEIAGLSFVPKPGGGWQFNTATTAAPVHYAVWTSNQDVVPPPDGDWTKFTPVGNGGASLFDPTQQRPACVTGYEGTRNQNVYSARITQGLLAYSPQNSKPLNVPRAFVVIVQNTTLLQKAFRLTLVPDSGVYASFQNVLGGVDQPLGSVDVAVPPASSIARSAFVHLTTGSANLTAGVIVNVAELADDGTCLSVPLSCPAVPGGLSSAVALNPPGSFPPGSLPSLVQPDGSGDPVATSEVYLPTISAASVTSPNLASVTSASVTSASVTSASVTSASVTSSHIAVPQLASVTSASVTSASVTSYNISNASVTSAPLAASVTSGNIFASVTSASISDANYTVTNAGNTTHSYHVKLVGRAPANTPIQLIVSKPYATPFAVGCQLVQDYRPVTVVNVDDVSPDVVSDVSQIPNPDIPDPKVTNATLTLAPGESGVITIRGPLDIDSMKTLTSEITPVVVPHAGGSFAAALLVTSDGSSLPAIQVGVPYSAVLQAVGGTAPYVWTLVAGSLPAGLSLGPDGSLSGTPQQATGSTALVQVTDSKNATATKSVTFTALPGPSTTTVTAAPAQPVYGSTVNLTVTVSAMAAGVGVSPPGGTVTIQDGGTTLGTVAPAGSNGVSTATLPPLSLSAGTHNLSAAYSGDSNYASSVSTLSLLVGQATPLVTVTGGPFVYDANPHPAIAAATGIGGVAVDGVLAITYSPGGTVPPVNAGAYVVTAAFTSADPNYGPALGTGTLTINRATPSVIVTGGTFAYDGTPHSASALATGVGGAAVAGTFVLNYTPGGLSAPVGVGTYGVTAIFSSTDPNYGNASGTGSITVTKANSKVTLASSLNPSTYKKTVTFTATVAALAPGSGTPTGTVAFKDGSTTLSTVALNASDVATYTTSALGKGAHTITAVYGGDANFNGASSPPLTQKVVYDCDDFLAPWSRSGSLQAPTSSGSAPYGSPVPIKWHVKDGAGTNLRTLSTTQTLVAVYAGATCPGTLSGAPITLYSSTQGVAVGSSFTYDSLANQFVFNWSATKNAQKGCYWIRHQLDDGSAERVTTILLK